jgi:hypothetical protein
MDEPILKFFAFEHLLAVLLPVLLGLGLGYACLIGSRAVADYIHAPLAQVAEGR